jgi:hypothetical protein
MSNVENIIKIDNLTQFRRTQVILCCKTVKFGVRVDACVKYELLVILKLGNYYYTVTSDD